MKECGLASRQVTKPLNLRLVISDHVFAERRQINGMWINWAALWHQEVMTFDNDYVQGRTNVPFQLKI